MVGRTDILYGVSTPTTASFKVILDTGEIPEYKVGERYAYLGLAS